nr:gustatory receptor 37 [Papilio dardanus]
MIYKYFSIYNIMFTIFGLRKPFHITDENKKSVHRICAVLWSLMVISLTGFGYFFFVNFNNYLNLKHNLPDIDGVNNLIVNLIIVVLELTSDDIVFVQIYNIVRNIFSGLKISDLSLRMFSYKLHLWIGFLSLLFLTLIINEFVWGYRPYVFIFKLPLFFTISHLNIHLCLLLAFLKAINFKLSQILSFNNEIISNQNVLIFKHEKMSKKRLVAYFLYARISFIEMSSEYIDIKSLCHHYDDVATCVRLLEINHGTQMFFIVWLMFSSAIIGVTIIIAMEKTLSWLVIAKVAQLYLWYYLCCYVNEQMCKEVEQTEILIMKYLINFKCDQSRRNLMSTFKQLVSTNRIQFTACNLFHLNYANILRTIVSVITYTIILNQLFWSGENN